jgi:hypothetical protein
MFLPLVFFASTPVFAIDYSIGGGLSSKTTQGQTTINQQRQELNSEVSESTEIANLCSTCAKKVVYGSEVQNQITVFSATGYQDIRKVENSSYSQLDIHGYGQ